VHSRYRGGAEGSEQWTVKFDLTLGPGKKFQSRDGRSGAMSFPIPDDGFWLKSAHLMVTDKTGSQLFSWPPIHVHHIVCRTNIADLWYEQEVFEHRASFLTVAGAGGMSKFSHRYTVLNRTDGWAEYYPAQTEVTCGLRIDDDRLVGDAQEYKLVVIMDLVIDADRRYGFRPLSTAYWEGTTTGQVGYNLPTGTTTLFSKEYETPGAGSFDPDSLGSHTHPGAKSLKLFAKRLGGQYFATPQLLFTMQHPVFVVKPGSHSQELNVKPGPYVRPPTLDWSEIGLKWLTGSLFSSGIDSTRECAFQKGDIFYLEAVHNVSRFTLIDMMTLRWTVFWNDPPQSIFAPGPYFQSGFLRNQLWDQYLAPADLLAQVPQKVDQSVMLDLHSRMPSLFCHPYRAADGKYVSCLRRYANKVFMHASSVNDVDMNLLAHRQKSCGQ